MTEIPNTHELGITVTITDPQINQTQVVVALDEVLKLIPTLKNRHDKLYEEDTEDEIEA